MIYTSNKANFISGRVVINWFLRITHSSYVTFHRTWCWKLWLIFRFSERIWFCFRKIFTELFHHFRLNNKNRIENINKYNFGEISHTKIFEFNLTQSPKPNFNFNLDWTGRAFDDLCSFYKDSFFSSRWELWWRPLAESESFPTKYLCSLSNQLHLKTKV